MTRPERTAPAEEVALAVPFSVAAAVASGWIVSAMPSAALLGSLANALPAADDMRTAGAAAATARNWPAVNAAGMGRCPRSRQRSWPEPRAPTSPGTNSPTAATTSSTSAPLVPRYGAQRAGDARDRPRCSAPGVNAAELAAVALAGGAAAGHGRRPWYLVQLADRRRAAGAGCVAGPGLPHRQAGIAGHPGRRRGARLQQRAGCDRRLRRDGAGTLRRPAACRPGTSTR